VTVLKRCPQARFVASPNTIDPSAALQHGRQPPQRACAGPQHTMHTCSVRPDLACACYQRRGNPAKGVQTSHNYDTSHQCTDGHRRCNCHVAKPQPGYGSMPCSTNKSTTCNNTGNSRVDACPHMPALTASLCVPCRSGQRGARLIVSAQSRNQKSKSRVKQHIGTTTTTTTTALGMAGHPVPGIQKSPSSGL